MFSFFLPTYVKQGHQFVKDARKILDYKRDLWSEITVTDFEREIKQMEDGCKERDPKKVETAAQALNATCTAMLPKVEDAAWRENCEVFLVAIVVALAVRTFFLQPFTIPTGSMQPTLNGILGYPTTQEPPNVLVRVWDAAIHGRTWINVVAKDDESISNLEEVSWLFFFTYTRIDTSKGNTYWIHAPRDAVTGKLGLNSLFDYQRGQPIVRGYLETGDHVFVDKMSYQFRVPQRGDVFVFNTERLPTNDPGRQRHDDNAPNDPADFDLPEVARLADQRYVKFDMSAPSQYYIKRLAGTPGDELRVDPPRLFVNGQLAEGRPFERVMSAQNGYQGYVNGRPDFLQRIMRTPDDPYTVPPKHYFAMGDNSKNSSDSRDWGPVPQQNIMGRGLFVYWPFGPHWGFIR